MDDGLSSFPQDTTEIDVGQLSNNEDEDDAAEKEQREKELQEELENIENEFSANEQAHESSTDDDSDNSDSESSDEESMLSHKSPFGSCTEKSSIKGFYNSQEFQETSAQPNEPDSVLDRPVIPPIDQYSAITESDVNYSKGLDVHYSKDYNVDDLQNSSVHYSNELEENFSKHSDKSCTGASGLNHPRTSDANISETEDENCSISSINHSCTSALGQSNGHFMHRTKYHQKSSVIQSNKFGKSHAFHTLPNDNPVKYDVEIQDQHDYGDVSSRITPEQYNAVLSENKRLKEMYNIKAEEVAQIQNQGKRDIHNLEKENKSLKLELQVIKGEKEKLSILLQDTNSNFSVISQDNNKLKGKLNALEFQLSEEKKARIDAQSKLESAEITIQSLQQQIKELNQSDTFIRLQHQNESVIKDLKLRHQREIFKYKEKIDKLQENLNSKTAESENFSSKLSQLQEKYDKLKIEKCDIFSKLSAKLEDSQRAYQELLDSGTASENSNLKLQLQHLKKEYSKLEKQNAALKENVRSLEEELRISETVKTLSFEEESLSEKKMKGQNSQSESNLKAELKKSLKMIQSLRSENNNLKKKLEDLTLKEEKGKIFESRFRESEEKRRGLEKKLEEVLPFGTIPFSEHEKKVASLENEFAECQEKLQELTERYKNLCTNEATLKEEIESLKSTIAEMSEKEVEERINKNEEFRKSCLEKCESVIANLTQNLTSKAESEKKKLCWDYENKIASLEKEIQSLNDGLYDSKAQYVQIFEKNKALEEKINSMTQLKEREEIEKEIKLIYEKKFKKMEEEFQKHKHLFESTLRNEVEKNRVEWTKQQMDQIQKFITKTKQELDDEFVKCLDKEKLKFEAEKRKILDECQEKINNLQSNYEIEKNRFSRNLQMKWESEINKLQQDHQAKIASLAEKFKKEKSSMENEIKILKEKSNYDFEKEAEKESFCKELMQRCEAEKNSFATQLKEHFQKKLESRIKDLQQDHQNKIESLKKSFKKEIAALEDEIHILKKNPPKEFKVEEFQILKEEHMNAKLAWENQKLDFIKNEHLLNDKLSIAVVKENELLEKVAKLKKAYRKLEKMHKEKNDMFEKQKEDLKRHISDKENELQLIKEKYSTCKLSLEKKHNQAIHIKNSESQTEDKVVPMNTILSLYGIVRNCLEIIKEAIKEFHKRGAERLQRALFLYHDYLTSKRATCASTIIGIPKVDRNLRSNSFSDNVSPSNAMQQQLISNYKISNSTPLDTVISNDNHKNLKYQMNNVSTVRTQQNEKAIPDIANGFADLSYDFVPIKMQTLEQTSVKQPHYSATGGVFHGERLFCSYPQRYSPLSQIKQHL